MERNALKAVVIVSGGLDSTTLLYWVMKQDYEPHVLSFDYRQRHRKELEFARRTCKKLGVKHKIVDLTSIHELLQGSALTSEGIKIPEEHYSHESQKITIVPNRNAIMLNIAVGYAISIGADRVFYAAHYNDKAIYPDCRWEFVQSQNITAKLANDKPELEIIAPFVHKTKAEIVKIASELGVPFEDTWSCYKGEEKACGVCGTCRERIEAFRLNKFRDPIDYKIDVAW
ncbi:MAG: 7-cyano-7-deazaguanine synthase QueC [Candidatus Hydrothermarchaeota archaeon]|nr:7-cyano-7-deazaguanine synthase QueC [Candidatus Hydrothermarchaeota archaeon]